MRDGMEIESRESREPRGIPAGRRVSGRLRAPPSKSVTNRYLNLALLSGRSVRLDHPLDSEDIRRFAGALSACGLRVTGQGSSHLEIAPGPAPPAAADLDCGASGTMFRFLVAALTAVPGRWRLDGIPRLRERTVAPLVEALRQLGARIDFEASEGFAPLVVHGGTLTGGRCVLDAGRSSQFLSAILMAAVSASGPVTVEVQSLTSGPYVDLTLEAIRLFGGEVERPAETTFRVHPGELRGAHAQSRSQSRSQSRFVVEGDFSAAGYPAAAALLTHGEVELEGLRRDSLQGDRGFLDVLQRMGARVTWDGDLVRIEPGADGAPSALHGVTEDLSSMPDQVPTLAALAPFATGTTRITDVPHLRIKESDRLAAMTAELGRAGVPVTEQPAGLEVPGVWASSRPPENPVVLESHGDHRIAMSCALVGLRRPGVSIADPGVVAKSYPRFWDDLDFLLGGRR